MDTKIDQIGSSITALYESFARSLHEGVLHLVDSSQQRLTAGAVLMSAAVRGHASLLHDLGHGVHDATWPRVPGRVLAAATRDVEVVHRGVVQVRDIKVDLETAHIGA